MRIVAVAALVVLTAVAGLVLSAGPGSAQGTSRSRADRDAAARAVLLSRSNRGNAGEPFRFGNQAPAGTAAATGLGNRMPATQRPTGTSTVPNR